MQYLYYGGPESLLIKNNEIMEVRNLSCHCGKGHLCKLRSPAHVGRSGGPVLGFRLGAGLGILLDSNRRLFIAPWKAGVLRALAPSLSVATE